MYMTEDVVATKSPKPPKTKKDFKPPKPVENTDTLKSIKMRKNTTNKEAKAISEVHKTGPSGQPETSLPEPSTSSGKRTKFTIEPTSQWYTAVPPLSPTANPPQAPTQTQLSELSARAVSLLTSDTKTYQSSSTSTGNSTSDSHFLQAILTKGTLSDRLSALTLLVQASPVHNSKALETLKGMAERGRGKGGRDEGLKAVRCVVDWWTGGGAPNRKLRYDFLNTCSSC